MEEKEGKLIAYPLYYLDNLSAEFDANVVYINEEQNQYHTYLGMTCFYPRGGGQPGDTGILGGIPIIDTYKTELGIAHISQSKPPFLIGDNVQGKVNLPRRFGFMQNHSGDHLFSGLALKHFGLKNVGFHLSETGMTMDFDRNIGHEDVLKLENEANEIIWKNIPIEITQSPFKEVECLEFRSKRHFDENDEVRLVKIGDYDLCACAGLHVRSTAEIAIMRITNIQKHKRGVRLFALCGKDALKDYQLKDTEIAASTRLLSANYLNLSGSIQRLMDEKYDLIGRINELQEKLFVYIAEEINDNTNIYWKFMEDVGMNEARKFSRILAKKVKFSIIFIGSEGGYSYIIAGSEDALPDFVTKFNGLLNGKGGISGNVAQGGIRASRAAIEATLKVLE